jgi:predicted hydrolase (HD superfamily)
MKDKAFARSVNRQDIVKSAEELGIPLEEHITFCIQAMREIAGELGLAPDEPKATTPDPPV